MGILEESSRRITKKNRTKFLILESVKIAGLMSVMLVAPNIVGAMRKLGIIVSPRQAEIAKRSYTRMIAAGLLKSDGRFLRLTRKGETELSKMLAMAQRSTPRRWDGKWRVLIFDIPMYRKGLRDKIRHTVQDIGFIRLQNSVWIYPYDCEDLLTLLKADLKVGKDLLYMVVDALEGDTWLRKEFKLSR
jgi:hypothetical protein